MTAFGNRVLRITALAAVMAAAAIMWLGLIPQLDSNAKAFAAEEEPVAIKIFDGNKVIKSFTLSELKEIQASEGSKKYSYSAYNRNVSYKGKELTDLEGPTLEGVLNAAGVDVNELKEKDYIKFIGYDDFGFAYTKGELFRDRFYFPKANNQSYLTGGALIESTMAGAVAVPPIISLGEKDMREAHGRLVFGQEYPNEQNYTAFTKYLIDEDTVDPYYSVIRITRSEPETWTNITDIKSNGSSIAQNLKARIGSTIDFDTPYQQSDFSWIVYTTDGTEPNMGSAKYNYNKEGDKNPLVITGTQPVTLKVKTIGYGKLGSETKTFVIKSTIPAPTSFDAARASYSSIKLTWKGRAGVTGYRVYRKSGTSLKMVADIKNVEGTSSYAFTNTGLKCGTSYTYKTRAYYTDDKGTIFSSYTVEKSAKPSLTTPTITALSQPSTKAAKLTWNKIAGASGYIVYRSLSKDSGYTVLKTVTSGSTISLTNTKLTKGKTYYYKVRAYRMVDNVKVTSGCSSAKSLKIIK